MLSISPDLKSVVPHVVVGWVTASVYNSQHNAALWQEIETTAARFRGVNMDEARKPVCGTSFQLAGREVRFALAG